MPKIQYQEINLRKDSLALIAVCNRIIREYTAAGVRPYPQAALLPACLSGYHPEQTKRIQARGVHRQRRQISGPDRLGCARRPYQKH